MDFIGHGISLTTYRVHDAAVGRWWQVDPKAEVLYGDSPFCAMGNNPITMADPDGDLPFLAAVGIGAAVGVFSNGLSNASQGQDFFDGAGKAALWGGIGAVASMGIGSAASSIFGSGASFGKAAFQFGAHGLSNGIQSHLQGGSFEQGFLSGGISSGIGSAIGATSLNHNDMAAAQIWGGALGGGIGSTISGDNFFKGFSQGLIVGAFNHALHLTAEAIESSMLSSVDPPNLKGFPGAEYQGKTKTTGRHTWKWQGKWLEWTNKAGGVIEMYDGKTKKKWLGKYRSETGKQLKAPNKTRWADAIKFGLRKFVRAFPIIYYDGTPLYSDPYQDPNAGTE